MHLTKSEVQQTQSNITLNVLVISGNDGKVYIKKEGVGDSELNVIFLSFLYSKDLYKIYLCGGYISDDNAILLEQLSFSVLILERININFTGFKYISKNQDLDEIQFKYCEFINDEAILFLIQHSGCVSIKFDFNQSVNKELLSHLYSSCFYNYRKYIRTNCGDRSSFVTANSFRFMVADRNEDCDPRLTVTHRVRPILLNKIHREDSREKHTRGQRIRHFYERGIKDIRHSSLESSSKKAKIESAIGLPYLLPEITLTILRIMLSSLHDLELFKYLNSNNRPLRDTAIKIMFSRSSNDCREYQFNWVMFHLIHGTIKTQLITPQLLHESLMMGNVDVGLHILLAGTQFILDRDFDSDIRFSINSLSKISNKHGDLALSLNPLSNIPPIYDSYFILITTLVEPDSICEITQILLENLKDPCNKIAVLFIFKHLDTRARLNLLNVIFEGIQDNSYNDDFIKQLFNNLKIIINYLNQNDADYILKNIIHLFKKFGFCGFMVDETYYEHAPIYFGVIIPKLWKFMNADYKKIILDFLPYWFKSKSFSPWSTQVKCLSWLVHYMSDDERNYLTTHVINMQCNLVPTTYGELQSVINGISAALHVLHTFMNVVAYNSLVKSLIIELKSTQPQRILSSLRTLLFLHLKWDDDLNIELYNCLMRLSLHENCDIKIYTIQCLLRHYNDKISTIFAIQSFYELLFYYMGSSTYDDTCLEILITIRTLFQYCDEKAEYDICALLSRLTNMNLHNIINLYFVALIILDIINIKSNKIMLYDIIKSKLGSISIETGIYSELVKAYPGIQSTLDEMGFISTTPDVNLSKVSSTARMFLRCWPSLSDEQKNDLMVRYANSDRLDQNKTINRADVIIALYPHLNEKQKSIWLENVNKQPILNRQLSSFYGNFWGVIDNAHEIQSTHSLV